MPELDVTPRLAVRHTLLRAIGEACDRQEIQPLSLMAPVHAGDLVPCEVPPRISISLDHLRVLAMVAGFQCLDDLFEEIEPG